MLKGLLVQLQTELNFKGDKKPGRIKGIPKTKDYKNRKIEITLYRLVVFSELINLLQDSPH